MRGRASAGRFGGEDRNGPAAAAAGRLLEVTRLPNQAGAQRGSPPGAFAAVVRRLNALPPGRYQLNFNFDYALEGVATARMTVYLEAEGVRRGRSDDPAAKIVAYHPVPATGGRHHFRNHATASAQAGWFQLVDPARPAPLPKGAYPAGRLTGLTVLWGFNLPNAQAGSPVLRIDNLSVNSLQIDNAATLYRDTFDD